MRSGGQGGHCILSSSTDPAAQSNGLVAWNSGIREPSGENDEALLLVKRQRGLLVL
jgi:hypothetical protein